MSFKNQIITDDKRSKNSDRSNQEVDLPNIVNSVAKELPNEGIYRNKHK